MSDRLNLGMRLHDTPRMGLEDRLSYIEKQGFTCAHAALGKLLPPKEAADPALTPGMAMELKRVFRKHGIDFAILGCYLNLADPDQKRAETIRKRYEAHIRLASLAGCGMVGTETGAPNSAYDFVPECHTEEALRKFTEGLRPVVEYAEKMGVIIGIEPVFTHIVHTPQRARRVLDEIGSPNLRIIFDPVNLLHWSNYKCRKEIVRDALELLGEEIAAVHIKDFVPDGGKLAWTAAGKGIMEYGEILSYLKQHKPNIHCTLEDTLPENAMDAAGYIRKLYEEVS